MSSALEIRLALIQMRCEEDRAANLARAETEIRRAARQGAHVACLPELFLGPYFCQVEDHCFFAYAEPIPGPTTHRLSGLARELNMVIVASLFEKRTEGLFHNTCAVIDADGQYLGKYRKMHIPDDPLYYEKFYFTPGDLGFRVFATRYARIGVLICWDQWFPEAARLTALQGAHLLLYPTAIGWHPAEKEQFAQAQRESWELIQRSHAVANGCFVGSVNRVGWERPVGDGIEFWGSSFICRPNGQILAAGSTDEEQLVMASLSLSEVEFARTHWPFWRDRRIDAYQDLTRRFIDDSPQG